jgi:hypothetical protein
METALPAVRLCLVLTLGSLTLFTEVHAQNVAAADRTVSVMAGAYSAPDNIPVVSSRLRFQTAPYGAAEFEFGTARGTERACALIITDEFDPCSERHFAVFLGFLTYGVSLPLAWGRPYAQAGAGAFASTDDDFLFLGIGSAGMWYRS